MATTVDAPRHAETTPRRQARAYALQVLYALDGRAEESSATPARAVAEWDGTFELELQLDESGRAFAKALVDRTVAGAGKVDELIIGASRNWRLERMSRVDRNILRLGTAELMPHGDGDASVATPVRIVINEAIELAKRFGTAESAAFVNGILDRIAGALGRGPES